MKKKLLLMLAVILTCFFMAYPAILPEKKIIKTQQNLVAEIKSIVHAALDFPKALFKPNIGIEEMLHKEASTLNTAVINKVMTTIGCATAYNIEHNHILTIIDYSLPSSEKRLWVFDLKEMKLLFHTYVSHGIKSGTLLTNYFSNKNNSKASSIGVYKTEKTYYGRDGLSLILDGLERGFNDNAATRYVVMHGGWYVEESFIKKYGRAGRSWGCPAIPPNLTAPIINTIKEKSLFVVYYPSDNWIVKSKFLNCDLHASSQNSAKLETKMTPDVQENEQRDDVLFANVSLFKKRAESEPIVVMPADSYQRIFHSKAPLERMLRRQINKMEYIALSNHEFKNFATSTDKTQSMKDGLNEVYFAIPVVKMLKGYYETQMQIVNLGKIKEVNFNSTQANQLEQIKSFTIHFEGKSSITLKATNRFIRWLGL